MTSSIQRVYAAAVTPRRLGTEDINLGAMWDLIDFLVSHGVQGIVLLGATGEFVHFSTSERMRLMGLASKRSRVPLIFNCSHSSFDGTVELTEAAEAAGAAAALIMPPFFFRYTQCQISDFYRQVMETTEAEIPLLLYNLPQFTSPLTFDTARQLLGDGIVQGIKDSSGDASLFDQLHAYRQEHGFSLMMGNDSLAVSALSAGCDGIISGVACAVPELLIALDRAVTGGAAEIVTRLEVRLRQFIERSDKLPTPVSIKEATSARGLKLGPHALSCEGRLEQEIGAFREWFQGWLPTVLTECKHA